MPTLAVVSLPLLHVVAVVSPHCESVVSWPLFSAVFFEDVKMLKTFFGSRLGDRNSCGGGLRSDRDRRGGGLRPSRRSSRGTRGTRDRIASALRGEAFLSSKDLFFLSSKDLKNLFLISAWWRFLRAESCGTCGGRDAIG